MTLEEEVARALCALTDNDPDGDGWVPGTRAWQDEDYLSYARAAIAIVVERCARIADTAADEANACYFAGLGGDAGKDRNAARYRIASRIAAAIRAEGGSL